MTYQDPIFERGLFGKANAFVVNAWGNAARAASDYAEGMEWAQRQVVSGAVTETWLAKCTTATLLAPNRWRYAFEDFDITSAAAPLTNSNTFGEGTQAINIRELRNTAGAIDGTPIPTGATVGPVGSVWNGTAWTTTNLEGYVWMHATYDTTGGTLFWFDTPNPVRCASSFFTEGEGGGES
jgi:hypothetical protein